MGVLKSSPMKTEWPLTEQAIQRRLSYFFASTKYDLDGLYVFEWESDKLLWTKSGYIYEFEIKISRSDYKNDFKHKVDKHAILGCDITNQPYMPDLFKHYEWNKQYYLDFEDYKKKLSENSRDLAKNHRKPNYFYYAVPEGLIQPIEVPPYAGLIWILKEYHNESQGYVIKKQAPKLHAQKYSDGELKLAEKFWYNWQSDRRLRREAQRDRDSVYRSLQEELASKGQEMTYKRMELKLKCAEESRDQYLKESVANGRDLRITSMLLRRVRHELLQVKPDFDYDALEAEVEKIYGIKK